MRLRIVSSPSVDPELDLGTGLSQVLADPAYSTLTIVSAWVKRSGLRRLADEIRAFRARGGRVSIITGIDENGATRQGLELARELADEVFVFHEPGAGTFHPKVYVAEGRRRASAFIGSANLTLGGLSDNTECSIEVDFELPKEISDLNPLLAWIEELRRETEVCLELTDELLALLIASGTARDEDRRRPRKSDDSIRRTPVLPFGKRSRPRNRARKSPRKGAVPAVAKRVVAATSAVAGPPVIAARWFKQLDASSAQQPPRGGTNVTGVLRLTRSSLPIDQTRYFRRTMFGAQRWAPKAIGAAQGETTTIQFEVTIAGKYLGRHSLEVTHAAHREANQGNVTTVLHWGPLSATIRAKNLTGRWVIIDRAANGSFALRVEPHEPMPV